tara:strand:- start:782 stop:1345 length:564 start_codon:yes stop_codon:yes gene_type:complete
MHNKYNIYYFIDNYDYYEINKLDKNITLIYRNYKFPLNIKTIQSIKYLCKLNKRKFFIANNLKIALDLKLDGIYIPSFNNLLNFKNIPLHKQFKIIGSAHNRIQLLTKQKQGCEEVFIAPLFKTKKNKGFLNVIKFNLIADYLKIKIIALGGIDSTNFKKLRIVKCFGFASISWIKKTGLKNIRPVL